MTAQRTIRIATRTSPLALWQANAVKAELEARGWRCDIVPIESTGDIQLTKPIYELGVTGVFTRQLDIALLDSQADIAVHSLKDVPVVAPQGLIIAAVLPRGAHEDVLLIKDKQLLENKFSQATIASSSLRRKAQWLAHYPNHQVVPIRGNVQTRLKKFADAAELDGIIFAKAGLERLGLLPAHAVVLDWMIPAPAQGIIGIACRRDDSAMLNACKAINHQATFAAGNAEREFLHTLMGGCSMPISALATVEGNEMELHGAVHAFNGSTHVDIHRIMLLSEWETAGKDSAERLLKQHGAQELIEDIRNRNNDTKGSFDQNA